jgi:hypothetical protein
LGGGEELRHERRNRKRQSGRMNITAVRLACAICLLLVVLVALASKASAMPGWWPQPTATSSGEMRSGGNQMAAYGSQLGHLAAQPSEVSDHTSYAFNWTDASIGAGFGAVLVPLLAGVSALLTDDGMSARFAAERRHDEGLVRRVESRRT